MENVHDLILNESEKFKDYFLNDEEKSISFFPKFNSINIIVGANNSGKSRFIRQLMSNNYFVGVKDLLFLETEIRAYNYRISNTNSIIDEKYNTYDENSKRTIYISGDNVDDQKAKVLLENRLTELNFNDIEDLVKIIKQNKANLENLRSFDVTNIFISGYSKINNDFIKIFKNFKKYYIPTLRTAHSLFNFDLDKYSKIESDIYLETLDNYYGLKNINIDVFTGVHLYKEILNTRNSKREIRSKFDKFEEFIRINFFDGKKIDIVAEFDKDESLKGNNNLEIISVHIEGEKETRKLYELGDGIQAIIILMYKIFMAEPDSFVFIDEPELNLHPGMQRLFLEQITTNKDLKSKKLNYIITTHSNHFLDLTIEKDNVSIYSFSPKNDKGGEKQFVIKNVNRGDNKLLKDLGVNNSSVFMANCSIWVEGISDRNYIKAFLKSYCNSIKKSYPKEDIDFAFFEYAGSNIDHYIFDDKVEKEDVDIVLNDIKALAISNRIFLLADSDASKQSSKKGIRLKELEDAKTDNFIPKVVWNIREIENLLTNEMWKGILIDLCNKTLIKSHETDILLKINEALSEVNYSDFEKKYVGEFLEELRKKMGNISKKSILNQSNYEVKSNDSFGTIINKRELSELVFNKNFSWEVLSKNKEIENLTIEIYDFITQKT
ncbi:AAA family ATPase [Flavobacterium sp. N3904]|uniref:AAA family ATPase n=1 Tax=Flavobacterium sp. N3904 TaxID=2986835 RepID=UPI0022249558|nr:AAA family ATPase [Flavobacterium sp. N3904]